MIQVRWTPPPSKPCATDTAHGDVLAERMRALAELRRVDAINGRLRALGELREQELEAKRTVIYHVIGFAALIALMVLLVLLVRA